jgi:hypothetical protein
MDRYLKDFAKIYGFNEPPRELTQEQVAGGGVGGGQVMLPKQSYE